MRLQALLRPVAIAVLLSPLTAIADPPAGQPDPSFGDADPARPGTALRSFDLGDGASEDVGLALAQDNAKRLVLAGIGHREGGKQCLGLMRFSADGVPDTSDFGFLQNNIATGRICHSEVTLEEDLDLVIQPDGKLIVGGTANIDRHPYICRFLPDGSKDDAFGSEATPGCVSLTQIETTGSAPAPTLLVRGESLLVVANRHTNGAATPVLARLSLDDGSIQPFGQQSFIHILPNGASAYVWDAALTEDGDVIAVGANLAGDNDFLMTRINAQTGQPSTGFNGTGAVSVKFNAIANGRDRAYAVRVLPGDKVLVAGPVAQALGNSIGLVQLIASNGTLDPAFNGGLPLVYHPCEQTGGCYLDPWSVDRTDDGHIVLGGAMSDGVENTMFSARLRADGSPDASFGSIAGLAPIKIGASGAHGMVLQDERVVLGGFAEGDGSDFALVRLGDGRLFSDGFEIAQ